MRFRIKLVTIIALVAVFLGAGSTAAWALYSATSTTASAVTIGKISATISGTSAITSTFSSTLTTITTPVTFANTGSVAGVTSTTVSVVSGSSTALAQAITVVAWPIATSAACTTSATVGTKSVTGTWASLPSMASSLAAGASAIWCIRSTPTSSAPASTTTNVNINLTMTTGSWTTGVIQGGFYLNTSATTPAFTCQDNSGNYVNLSWTVSNLPLATYYGAFINGTMVGDKEQGYSGVIPLSSSVISKATAPDGSTTVNIMVLDSSYKPTTTVAATGKVTLFVQNSTRAIKCGG
jgi:hypothetical protein